MPTTYWFDTARRFESKVANFPDEVYALTNRHGNRTHLYNLLYTVLEDAGIGYVRKVQSIAEINEWLSGTRFSELDAFFGDFLRIDRYPEELYPYDPFHEPLTTDQWDEVTRKDASYRERIGKFLKSLQRGGTAEGLALAAEAAGGFECQVFELWRRASGLGLAGFALGRLNSPREFVVAVKTTQPGSDDNLLTANQASLETDTTGWGIDNANTTIARDTSQAAEGVASLRLRSVAAGDIGAETLEGTAGIPVTEGQIYSARAEYRPASTTRITRLHIVWWTAAGVHISNHFADVAEVAGQWTTVSATGVAPPTAAFASVAPWVLAAGAANEDHFVDKIGFYVGSFTGWKQSRLSESRQRSIYRTLERVKPANTIATVSPAGLDVHSAISCQAVGASSEYFEVQKFITGVNPPPAPPEHRYYWIEDGVEVEAPSFAHLQAMETSWTLNRNIVSVRAFNMTTPAESDTAYYIRREVANTLTPSGQYTLTFESPDLEVITDDFERSNRLLHNDLTSSGHQWVEDLGPWEIVSNQAKSSGAINATPRTIRVDAKSADYTIQCSIKLSTVRAAAGIVFRETDSATNLSAYLQRAADNSVNAIQLRKKVQGEGDVVLASVTGAGLNLGQTYLLKIEAIRDVINIYVDGILKITHTLSATDFTTFTDQELVGLWEWLNTGLDDGGSIFDNFSVTPSSTTRPLDYTAEADDIREALEALSFFESGDIRIFEIPYEPKHLEFERFDYKLWRLDLALAGLLTVTPINPVGVDISIYAYQTLPSVVRQGTLQYAPWREVEIADAPDNFPAGKYPSDQSRYDADGNYVFPWASQPSYYNWFAGVVRDLGGRIETYDANRLKNPTLEDFNSDSDPDDWVVSDPSKVGVTTVHSQPALRIERQGPGGSTTAEQTRPITELGDWKPGDLIALSGDGFQSAGFGFGTIVIRLFDQVGYIGEVPLFHLNYFERHSSTFVLPSRSTSLTVKLIVEGGAGTDFIVGYFRKIQLEATGVSAFARATGRGRYQLPISYEASKQNQRDALAALAASRVRNVRATSYGVAG